MNKEGESMHVSLWLLSVCLSVLFATIILLPQRWYSGRNTNTRPVRESVGEGEFTQHKGN